MPSPSTSSEDLSAAVEECHETENGEKDELEPLVSWSALHWLWIVGGVQCHRTLSKDYLSGAKTLRPIAGRDVFYHVPC
jgi:hypothetical protein